MRIMLACGEEGLLEYRDKWRRIPCPLACPTQLALTPGTLAVADQPHRLLWAGHTPHTIDSGLEAMALWQRSTLTLFGDTDSLVRADLASGTPQILTPAGVYPQDFCFADASTLAVCGGMDGSLRLMTLPDLVVTRELTMPGASQRVVRTPRGLAVLCLTGDDVSRTLLCRVSLPDGAVTQVCTLAGLPGALCADGRGGLWLGVSERLAHFAAGEAAPDLLLPGFGLPRHLARMGSHVLVTDPLAGVCTAADCAGHVRTLYAGDVRQAVLTE